MSNHLSLLDCNFRLDFAGILGLLGRESEALGFLMQAEAIVRSSGLDELLANVRKQRADIELNLKKKARVQ
jgi:hypothetical protein